MTERWTTTRGRWRRDASEVENLFRLDWGGVRALSRNVGCPLGQWLVVVSIERRSHQGVTEGKMKTLRRFSQNPHTVESNGY